MAKTEPTKKVVQPTIQLDESLLRAGLNVVVIVVRGDGKVVQQVPWTTAVSRLIGSFLSKLPKKRFGQDKRDERLSEALSLAGGEEQTRYLSIGRKPWVWM
jgi:hypothetical protein